MNYDEFFALAEKRALRIASDHTTRGRSIQLSNEALFQLPLLAMVVMILAKGQRKPVPEELGQLVGECLERAVSGFKESPQGIGWSANLRIRTVKALMFLEVASLVTILRQSGAITLTDFGRRVLDRVFETDGPLAFTLATVERSYRNIAAEKNIQGRLL